MYPSHFCLITPALNRLDFPGHLLAMNSVKFYWIQEAHNYVFISFWDFFWWRIVLILQIPRGNDCLLV